MEAFDCKACSGQVRAYRALIGLDFVLFRDGAPVAWRIAGAHWNYNAKEAREVLAKFSDREEEVPEWAKTYSDLYS